MSFIDKICLDCGKQQSRYASARKCTSCNGRLQNVVSANPLRDLKMASKRLLVALEKGGMGIGLIDEREGPISTAIRDLEELLKKI